MKRHRRLVFITRSSFPLLSNYKEQEATCLIIIIISIIFLQIMELFENVPHHQRPRIVGLTAALLNGNVKLNAISQEIHNLEITLHATICRAKNEKMLRE